MTPYSSALMQIMRAGAVRRSGRKDGGEFAKGLENWLAPTKGRYQEGYEFADAAQDEPRRLVI